tara:strand:- start:2961 stop:3290 length:330 start_codon:yes stop_codon:yes gene_type:complete
MSSEYLKQTLLADEIKKAEVADAVAAALGDKYPVVVEELRDRQVLIRVAETQRSQWQEAAESDGTSVSEWLRQMADARWREIFTCTHPLEQRQVYPWSEVCLDCGTKLR